MNIPTVLRINTTKNIRQEGNFGMSLATEIAHSPPNNCHVMCIYTITI